MIRGTRFSCTPYYPDAPHPPHPVPPVSTSSSTETLASTPELVRRFTSVGSAPIWQSIQYMDHEGMDLIRRPAEKGAVAAWERYLTRTKVS